MERVFGLLRKLRIVRKYVTFLLYILRIFVPELPIDAIPKHL